MMGAVLWTIGLFAMSTILVTISPWAFDQLRRVHSYGHTAAAVGIASMVAGFALVRSALVAFADMRGRLSDIGKGIDRRLQGAYPAEVRPLVDEVNALLQHREEAIRRAVAKAGDLAHGLKTPLAVLAQEADRAAAAGQRDVAGAIAQQVERMRRQIDYHLAHARAAASGAATGARCSVIASAEGLARTLQRLHADRGMTIQVDVPPDHSIRGQREDLDEMLGNLLDNACKWARSRVVVASTFANGAVVITVDDDGPGLEPSKREVVLQRGVRADEAAPGSGLGLAIVRDLAELYGGTIALDCSPVGGLRARLQLPA